MNTEWFVKGKPQSEVHNDCPTILRENTVKARYLEDVETDTVQLEVYECECGFHIGLDFTYLEQVGEATIQCPSCSGILTIPAVDDDEHYYQHDLF